MKILRTAHSMSSGSNFNPEIPVAVEHIESAHSVVFGDQGFDLGAPELPAWASVPDNDLAYHVAHELYHIVQRQRGYPKTVRGSHYAAGSVEARIGADLEEMILHPPLEELLRGEMGFTNDFHSKPYAERRIERCRRQPGAGVWHALVHDMGDTLL